MSKHCGDKNCGDLLTPWSLGFELYIAKTKNKKTRELDKAEKNLALRSCNMFLTFFSKVLFSKLNGVSPLEYDTILRMFVETIYVSHDCEAQRFKYKHKKVTFRRNDPSVICEILVLQTLRNIGGVAVLCHGSSEDIKWVYKGTEYTIEVKSYFRNVTTVRAGDEKGVKILCKNKNSMVAFVNKKTRQICFYKVKSTRENDRLYFVLDEFHPLLHNPEIPPTNSYYNYPDPYKGGLNILNLDRVLKTLSVIINKIKEQQHLIYCYDETKIRRELQDLFPRYFPNRRARF